MRQLLSILQNASDTSLLLGLASPHSTSTQALQGSQHGEQVRLNEEKQKLNKYNRVLV